jgi:hypothetical protein
MDDTAMMPVTVVLPTGERVDAVAVLTHDADNHTVLRWVVDMRGED